MKRPVLTTALASLALLGMVKLADAAGPSRTRGTIDAVSGTMLDVTARDGKKASFKLVDKTGVAAVKSGQPSDIKDGSFIGTAAVPQADGTLKALEVHVFAPSLAGTGEGHYAWDLGNNSTMTNGTVGHVVVTSGRTIDVSYGNGEKKIVVPEDVPVVSLEPGDRSLLKPGAKVIVFSLPDDPSVAARIAVGVDGVAPPM